MGDHVTAFMKYIHIQDESKCELWVTIMHQWSFTLVRMLTMMDACEDGM